MAAIEILQCQNCKRFTLKKECSCGGKGITPIPPKYSPEDAYAKYRRQVKEEERKNSGLI
jgi:rRNA maturation protein Nop10